MSTVLLMEAAMDTTECLLCEIIHPAPEVCGHRETPARLAEIRAAWLRCTFCNRWEANGAAPRVCYHLAGSGVDRRKVAS